LFNVPVVKAFASEIKNLKEFIEYVRGIKNAEGCIIRWADGHMTKIKGDEYCFLHRGKEALQFEKDVIQMIVNKKVDDFLPSLDASDSAALTKYHSDKGECDTCAVPNEEGLFRRLCKDARVH
jgi:hypothetical protein